MTLTFRVRARRGDFSLDVACTTRARALVVVGPSGAGKTTLLQALAGLSPGGTVHLSVAGETMVDTEAGLDPAPHRRGVGSVFQDGRSLSRQSAPFRAERITSPMCILRTAARLPADISR